MQAIGGIGPANAHISGAEEGYHSRGTTGYAGEVGIGRQWGNVLINTGIGYMVTGRDATYNYWINSPEHPGAHKIVQARKSEHYDHAYIPLSIGYKFFFSERLSFIPAIGALGSLNLRARFTQTDKVNMTNVYHIRLFDLEHTYEGNGLRPFNKYSLWGTVKVEMAYEMKPGLSMLVGCVYYRMLTSVIDPAGYHANIFPDRMYNYALLAHLGIRYTIGDNGSRNSMTSCGRW